MQSRVEKLEADPRVPPPCWFCALVGRASQVFNDYLTKRGVTLPEPVCVDEVCRFCGAVGRRDIVGLTPEGRTTVSLLRLNSEEQLAERHNLQGGAGRAPRS